MNEAGLTEDRDRVVRGWGWPPHRRRLRDLGRWPYRVGICAALATWVGVLSLVERDALSPPEWAVIALVSLAVLPWLVDLLVIEVPSWLFAPAVLVPVGLLYEPERFDPLPFLLAVLVLDMALWLGLRWSAVVLLASVVVVAWNVSGVSADVDAVAEPLVAMGVAWLVGLALHSQVRRVARIRGQQQALIEQAVRDERERLGVVVRESVSRRARAMLEHLDAPAVPTSGRHVIGSGNDSAADGLADEVVSDLERHLGVSSNREARE